ncbi:MAG TPA: PAS domain-containing sensor histidine kinase [Burkholderiaceae bacterium]|nr:PAS domain-containing sensor histidine kinase [Burkholderiaceae bacterium]
MDLRIDPSTVPVLHEFEAIYRSAPIGLGVLDRGLRFVRVNQRLAEINGVPVEAHVGRTVREIVPDLLAQAEALLRRVLETGEPVRDVEVVGETPAHPGERRVWIEQWHPVRDDAGTIVGVSIVVEEVTALRQARAALRERERRLYALFRQAPGFIVVLDGPEHRVLFQNDAYVRLFGRPDAVGRPIREVFPDLEGQPYFDLLDRVYRSGEGYAAYGAPVRLAQGPAGDWTEVVVDFLYEPIRDERGAVTGIFVEGIDATERQRALRALEAGERRYRELFDSIDEGFCIVEVLFDDADRAVDYRFVEANAAFRTHTGLADPVGRTARELVPGLEPVWFETYGRIALGGESIRFQERSASLAGRYLDVYAFRSGDPSQRRVAILFSDITERERLLSDLREADRRKDEFLAMLAHELRNPLAPLRNGLHVLAASRLDARSRGVVELCVRQTRLMTRLVDDLLEVSRISRGLIELRPEPLQPAQAIGAVVESLADVLDARRQRVEIDLPSEAPRLEADPVRFAQMLGNLIGNASKYSPPGAGIVVRVRAAGDDVEIDVIDVGIGLAPENLERVFEMFIQVDATLERSEGGLGIGLGLVRKLAQAHGGRVSVRSPGLGRGSTFTLVLPATAAGGAGPPAGADRGDAGPP